MPVEDNSYDAAIVAALEQLREERGVSYRALSERTGINRGSLSKHLTGKNSLKVSTLRVLSEGIGVDMFAVLRLADERMKQQ